MTNTNDTNKTNSDIEFIDSIIDSSISNPELLVKIQGSTQNFPANKKHLLGNLIALYDSKCNDAGINIKAIESMHKVYSELFKQHQDDVSAIKWPSLDKLYAKFIAENDSIDITIKTFKAIYWAKSVVNAWLKTTIKDNDILNGLTHFAETMSNEDRELFVIEFGNKMKRLFFENKAKLAAKFKH